MSNAIMDSKQFIEIRRLIENEFSHAVTKHPKFADLFTNQQTDWAHKEERNEASKKWRDKHKDIYNARMRAYRKRQKEQKQAPNQAQNP